MSEEKKKRLKEYKKKYSEAKKSKYNKQFFNSNCNYNSFLIKI